MFMMMMMLLLLFVFVIVDVLMMMMVERKKERKGYCDCCFFEGFLYMEGYTCWDGKCDRRYFGERKRELEAIWVAVLGG
jgi:hypothetical protein